MQKTRILPADGAWRSCHASTLVETAGGNLLCAFFAGSREGHPDVGIYWTRCREGRWAPPTLAAKTGPVAHWNPVLFRDRSGELSLFFKVGKGVAVWRTCVRRSADDGVTWSAPEDLVPGDSSGGRGPVKNKPIQLADGTILAPASWEGGGWRAFVDISRDGGRTWTCTALVPPPVDGPPIGVIQPTLWESEPGRVHMLLRSQGDCLYRSDSVDAGRAWSPLRPAPLVHNNSGIDLVRLADGTLLLAHNPTRRRPPHGDGRHRLALSVSRDNGATWREACRIEDGPEADAAGHPHEYSYPAVIVRRSGSVVISYTDERRAIAVVELEPSQGGADIPVCADRQECLPHLV